MNKDDAKLAVEVINGIVKLFSQATSAYEKSKRLEVEMAELNDKRYLAEKNLDLKKLEIEKAYQEFEQKCNLIDKNLSIFEKNIQALEMNEKYYRKQSDKILSLILKHKGEVPSLVKLWESLQLLIENSMERRVNNMNKSLSYVSDSAKALLATTHNGCVGFSARRQIGQGE